LKKKEEEAKRRRRNDTEVNKPVAEKKN